VIKPKTEKLLDRLNAGHYIVFVNAFGRADCMQLRTTDYLKFMNDVYEQGGHYASAASMKEQGLYMVTIDKMGHPAEVIAMTKTEKRNYFMHVLGERF